MRNFLVILLLFSTAQAQKILHYTETTGYNHNTKSQSLSMFQSFALSNGWTVEDDDSGDQFTNIDTLNTYDVVIFTNTSGAGGLDAIQRTNFEAYIAGGGSYLGIHAASDTYRHSSANGGSTGNWDWYAETVAGASIQENPNHTSSNHNNNISKPINQQTTNNLPNVWNKTEEYYYWQFGYRSPDFTEILLVGSTGSNTYDVQRMVAQIRELPGGGKAFYTSLGHSASDYTSDANFRTLLEDALIWIFEEEITFGIIFPEPEQVPSLEDGNFHIEGFEGAGYRVFDINGREVFAGVATSSGVPVYLHTGIFVYRLTGHKSWKSATIEY